MVSISRAPTTLAPDNVGYIVVDELPRELVGDLADAGVSEDDLRELAGRDGVIRGADELDNLFARIDEPQRALAVVRGRSLFDALAAQVERNRIRAGEEGGKRFLHDPVLRAVLEGGPSLGRNGAPESVFRVEQALADLGLLSSESVDGDFDAHTLRAVERFQIEAELAVSGRIDAPTLGALVALSPAPGARLVRRPEYARLEADDRLAITVVLGAEDRTFTRLSAEAALVDGLLDRGFERVSRHDTARLDALGVGGVDPHIDIWTSGATHLFVAMPGASMAERSVTSQVAERSNAVLFAGRRFTVGEHQRPSAGLRAGGLDRPNRQGPDYQLFCLSGCTEFEGAVRERLLHRTHVDTDLFSTDEGAPEASRAEHALGFLDVIRAKGSTDDLRRVIGDRPATERGFLSNRSNQAEVV